MKFGTRQQSFICRIAVVVLLAWRFDLCAQSTGNTSPLSNSVATPRPFDPGQNTTNPSALAVQSQNPFLGSVPTGPVIPGILPLSLHLAVSQALRANLGFIESKQGHAQSWASRIRALSTILPQVSTESTETYRNLVADTLGVDKLGFPHLVPPFNYQSAGLVYKQDLFNVSSIHEIKAAGQEVEASAATLEDAKNIVVLAAVSSYLLVAASQTRVATVEAQVATARATDQLLENRVRHEVSPEIDRIRTHVALRSAEQRLLIARITLEKDKLALTRIIGLPIEQQFELTDALEYHKSPDQTLETSIATAIGQRQDLKAAAARVKAAEQVLQGQKAQRLPVVSVQANAGEAGATYGRSFGEYSVEGRISLPIFTGRRIQSDIATAEATFRQRSAEFADVRARAIFDVRRAVLDLEAGKTSVEVALENGDLAQEGLRQARDRFEVGVSNTVDLIQAEQAVAEAEDNRISSIYAHSLAKLVLLRAMGTAEQDYTTYLGVH
jgi:outer membrane protein TolC